MEATQDTYGYDVVGNPTSIEDGRNATEWPAGAKPVQRTMAYDDLYRLTAITYGYAGTDDTWVSPHDAENRVAANPGGNPTLIDSRRAKPSPHVSFTHRVKSQTYAFDWLGNTTTTDDDAHGFYDRSLGPIVNDTAKPYQLKTANNATLGGTRTGSVDTVYDAAGHLVRLNVKRNGPCLPAGALCGQRYYYAWDEVGRLMLARRWDMASATMPAVTAGFPTNASAAATLRFAYDASDDRTVKHATDPSGNNSYTVYAHPTLEFRRTTSADPDGAGPLLSEYAINAMTEVPYLEAHGARLGRVVWEPAAKNVPEYAADGFPNPAAGKLHVFFELGDHLGSTSLAIDKSTSELVEQSTYLAYGQTESDYRPDRWGAFREDYRFTGKEEDSELGLVYFGKRYLNAQLGRWMSFDPLTMHGLGADLNGYAYVAGRVLQNTDPFGLAPDGTDNPGNGPDTVSPEIVPSTPTEPPAPGIGEGARGTTSGSGAAAPAAEPPPPAPGPAEGARGASSTNGKDPPAIKPRRPTIEDTAEGGGGTSGAGRGGARGNPSDTEEPYSQMRSEAAGEFAAEQTFWLVAPYGASRVVSGLTAPRLTLRTPKPPPSVGGTAAAETGAELQYAEGSFSIVDWSGYPAGMPRPVGPVRVIAGEEYNAARALANKTNRMIRKEANLAGSGWDVHEVQPIRFGGSPVDPANKVLLPKELHTGRGGVHPQFWTPLLRWATGRF